MHLRGKTPIIGVGGIATEEDAWEKMVAGADYLQLYSAFIFQGPKLIREIVEGLAHRVNNSTYANLESALQAARADSNG